MTSVFTSRSLPSAKNGERTLQKAIFDLCWFSLLFLAQVLVFIFSELSLFVFVTGTPKTYRFPFSTSHVSLCLLSSVSPSTFSHLFPMSLSPCCPPLSRQNQLKEQVQQALVSPSQLPEEAECLTVPKYKRDLVQKLKILRQELSQQQPQAGHCRIEVSREEIFEVRMERHWLRQACSVMS